MDLCLYLLYLLVLHAFEIFQIGIFCLKEGQGQTAGFLPFFLQKRTQPQSAAGMVAHPVTQGISKLAAVDIMDLSKIS